MEEDNEEQQNIPLTAKVGAKKQKKLEEKQAKKAQREVKGSILQLLRAGCEDAVPLEK